MTKFILALLLIAAGCSSSGERRYLGSPFGIANLGNQGEAGEAGATYDYAQPTAQHCAGDKPGPP